MRTLIHALTLAAGLLLGGCAATFPGADPKPAAGDGLDGPALLEQCIEAHGGDLRNSVREVRLALSVSQSRSH